MSWNQFNDNQGPNNTQGVNNAYDLGDGYQIHCHGENFQGPAFLKNQRTGEKLSMSPGDALYAAAMLDFSKKYL